MPRQHGEQEHEQHIHLPAGPGSSTPTQWSDLGGEGNKAGKGENVYVLQNSDAKENVSIPPEFLVEM